MSIEQSGTAVAPTRTEKSGAAFARAHAPGGNAASAGGAPSFLSLLTAQDADTAAQSGAGAIAAPDVAGAIALPILPVDPAALLAQNANRAIPLGEADAVTAGTAPGLAETAAPVVALGVAGAQCALLAPGARMAQDNGPPGQGLGAHQSKPVAWADVVGTGSGTRGIGPVVDLAEHSVKSPVDEIADPLAAQASPGQGQGEHAAPEPANTLAGKGSLARLREARVAGEIVNTDARTATATRAEAVSLAAVPWLEAGGSSFKGQVNNRGAERAGPRTLLAPAGSATVGSWAEQALAGGGVAAPAIYVLDAATPAPETVVAEKVHYWISRGVQNAEMRLDAFGGASVDVSVAVQGSEALVEFRSDQPEARKLLQDAMGQLKDMLKGEGLVLSGGFVGTSAQRDPGAQGRRSEAQGGRTMLLAVETQSLQRDSAPGRTQGRTVDVFV